MKLLFISVVALCLAGCATEAVLPSQAKQAPKERLLKFQSPGVGEQAKLIVVRDKGFLGSGCFVGVYLNQEKAAILDPGEKAEFYLKPGEWNVYDIIYSAPIFKEDGTYRVPPRVTVIQNGIVLQNNTTILGTTEYIGFPKVVKHGAGPIRLQSHGDPSEPISFRNIWIREM